jgi:hypothetical protein
LSAPPSPMTSPLLPGPGSGPALRNLVSAMIRQRRLDALAAAAAATGGPQGSPVSSPALPAVEPDTPGTVTPAVITAGPNSERGRRVCRVVGSRTWSPPVPGDVVAALARSAGACVHVDLCARQILSRLCSNAPPLPCCTVPTPTWIGRVCPELPSDLCALACTVLFPAYIPRGSLCVCGSGLTSCNGGVCPGPPIGPSACPCHGAIIARCPTA